MRDLPPQISNDQTKGKIMQTAAWRESSIVSKCRHDTEKREEEGKMMDGKLERPRGGRQAVVHRPFRGGPGPLPF